MVIRFPAIRTGQIVVGVFRSFNIINIDRLLQQQRRHTHLLVLVYMVLVVIDSDQQLRLVLAYSRMILVTNGQQI
jgi:hypothetical protein